MIMIEYYSIILKQIDKWAPEFWNLLKLNDAICSIWDGMKEKLLDENIAFLWKNTQKFD